ncbi:MAG TPA: class I SAM-dependent methyltransferase [Mycobacteriales bacterium]|nr:class I SAM-dependent methyltransferase [Mycobacteriales bacterium]
MEETVRRRLSAAFDDAVDRYERARPTYPVPAVRWLVPPAARTLLDVGAGTGKLTRVLVGLGYSVTAVEPLAGMLAELARLLPGVTVLAGTAERLPVPAASVDAVLVAQAWHWFDERAAAVEAARVLRPGGYLGLLWNELDDAVPWIARLRRLIGAVAQRAAGGPVREEAVRPELGPLFGPPDTAQFRHSQRVDLPTLLDGVASRSYVITRPAAERDRLLADVAELARTHPDTAGRAEYVLPYRTRCWRACRRTGAAVAGE